VARLTRFAGIAGSLFLAGVLLSSCGEGGAVTDARTSCRFVHKAIALQDQSNAAGVSASRKAQLQADALSELLKGTQSAANATSADGSWNVLQTTINEAERVPLTNLIPALQNICKVANSSSPYVG
jgi:hypothetical protein